MNQRRMAEKQNSIVHRAVEPIESVLSNHTHTVVIENYSNMMLTIYILVK